MSNRTQITYELFAAMMGDCKAVEIDGQYLCYPEVYTDQVLLTYWNGNTRVDEVIEQSSFHDLYIDSDDMIQVAVKGLLTTIEILTPIPSTIDLANMLK
jgi:hypothetical protein